MAAEVSLFFNHTLYRGNRVFKYSSNELNAFNSPNLPPLVQETFGAGNAPQRADFMDALKEACNRGVVIVAISQCSKGSVSAHYETGIGLLKVGVVSGGDMTPECALTKLGYLLSKPELSVTQVRTLIGTPLRGELTVPASNLPRSQSGSGIDESLQSIQGLLSQVVRLSASHSSTPTLVVSSESDDADIPDDSAAPWSWTAAEAASTESALLPFLMHLAAARDDIAGMKFCLRENRHAEVGTEGGNGVIVGGVADCIDAASGRSPLHVAALNGSIHCVNILLEAGALVHLRDSLGHTPLYYAARQGHEEVVDLLVKAGANLGGSDIEGGFASLISHKAALAHDERAVRIWTKAGEHE
ncbi:hypothetical protein EIP86_004380 [Pleurotus ostreatoroseus]|nr:hypothetical protein EIP86_004380 [Pleurotus ostreatoroseus]